MSTGNRQLKKMTAKSLLICDTTLRDGEQAPGVAFTHQEKVSIAKMLDEIGVPQIEAGIPSMGVDERLTVRAIANSKLKAQIIAWSRALTADVEDCLACGVNAISISMPVSDILLKHKLGWDRKFALQQMQSILRYAQKRQFGYVYVGAEDSSRADIDFLIRLARLARDEGAQRFRFADTMGILDPFRTYRVLKKLVDGVPGLDIEIHAHNDFGMATANTLAAIKAGVKSVSTTVCGLGERAGNAPMEEVVMALKYQEGISLQLDTRRFKELAGVVSRAANRPISLSKPVVGDAVFTHESGIHVDALLKNLDTYQVIDPDEVGQTRRYVIGKMSGSAGLMHKLDAEGIYISLAEARLMLPRVRQKAVELKRALDDREVLDLYYNFHNSASTMSFPRLRESKPTFSEEP